MLVRLLLRIASYVNYERNEREGKDIILSYHETLSLDTHKKMCFGLFYFPSQHKAFLIFKMKKTLFKIAILTLYIKKLVIELLYNDF